MSENTFKFESTKYEESFSLKNAIEDQFITLLNETVNPFKGIEVKFDEQYFLIFPQYTIDDTGRNLRLPLIWKLEGVLCKNNADEHVDVNIGVDKIEALTIKTIQGPNRLKVIINTSYKCIEDIYLPWLMKKLSNEYPELALSNTPGEPGRNKISGEDLMYRLAKAQEAEEIRRAKPQKTWREIAKDIGWIHGCDKSGVKLLYYARLDVDKYKEQDPDGLLAKAMKYREDKEKEKK